MRWLKFIGKLIGRTIGVLLVACIVMFIGCSIGTGLGSTTGRAFLMFLSFIVLLFAGVFGVGYFIKWSFSPPLLEKRN